MIVKIKWHLRKGGSKPSKKNWGDEIRKKAKKIKPLFQQWAFLMPERRHNVKPGEPFILCEKYTKLQVKKEDGTTVAAITKDDWNLADGYTIVLTPNYDCKD